jgi:hypothetical protein
MAPPPLEPPLDTGALRKGRVHLWGVQTLRSSLQGYPTFEPRFSNACVSLHALIGAAGRG